MGSALGGLEARIRRHLRAQKAVRWHIDYLLARPEARIVGVYILETMERPECRVAEALAAEFERLYGLCQARARGERPREIPVIARGTGKGA